MHEDISTARINVVKLTMSWMNLSSFLFSILSFVRLLNLFDVHKSLAKYLGEVYCMRKLTKKETNVIKAKNVYR